jgi:hypothetical protein
MDDIVKVPGQFEAPGVAKIPEDGFDGKTFQEMKVGCLAHQAIDIMPSGQKPAAEIGADKAVGPGDENLLVQGWIGGPAVSISI